MLDFQGNKRGNVIYDVAFNAMASGKEALWAPDETGELDSGNGKKMLDLYCDLQSKC